MLSSLSCSRMRPKGRLLLNPWLSSQFLMVMSGVVACQNSSLSSRRSWETEILRIRQDNQVWKLSVPLLKIWLQSSESMWMIWRSTSSQLSPSWWLRSRTRMTSKLGMLKRRPSSKPRTIQHPSPPILYKESQFSLVRRQPSRVVATLSRPPSKAPNGKRKPWASTSLVWSQRPVRNSSRQTLMTSPKWACLDSSVKTQESGMKHSKAQASSSLICHQPSRWSMQRSCCQHS